MKPANIKFATIPFCFNPCKSYVTTQPAFTCSRLLIVTLKKSVKDVKS